MFKLDLEKAEAPEIKLPTSVGKARDFQKNIYFCFIDYTKAFDCVDHNKLENSSSQIEFLFKYTTFIFANLIKAPPSISAGLLAKDQVSLPSLLVLSSLLGAIHYILYVLGSHFCVLTPNWSWELCVTSCLVWF